MDQCNTLATMVLIICSLHNKALIMSQCSVVYPNAKLVELWTNVVFMKPSTGNILGVEIDHKCTFRCRKIGGLEV